MTAGPADTFAQFLDVLAGGLDDDTLTGAGFASRLHLSRFHFDRIISSIAGEPPQALRRRVLLERAAYRLISTDRHILDVAIEAGYSSHEAFTRAFRRAFGDSPSAWRHRPGGIRIEAPSDVHFHPPASLRLPTQQRIDAMDLLTRMIEHHIWLTGQMIDVASRLDPTTLDERIEVSVDEDPQTIRSLLSRLVGQMGMWNAALDNRAYDWAVEDHESITSLHRRLAQEGPAFLNNVRDAVDAGRLDDTFVDALCDPVEVFTYGGMIAHVLTFAAHRRSLVALALDAAGHGELGFGDPMKWVAEPAPRTRRTPPDP